MISHIPPPESGKLYQDPIFPPNAYSLLGLYSIGNPTVSIA